MELIPSKDVCAFMQELNHEFTDAEKATIIYNSHEKRNVRFAELRKLMERTEDSDLKQQIKDRLDYEDKVFCVFAASRPDCVYALCYLEDESRNYKMITDGYFSNLEAARKSGLLLEQDYQVEKIKIQTTAECKPGEDLYESFGYANYDEAGLLTFVYSYEVNESEDPGYDDDKYQRFEHAYLTIPYPFKRGDIVRNVVTGEVGIVYEWDLTWNWEKMDAFLREKGLASDYSDTGMNVEMLDEYGEFGHTHPSPLELEFANLTKEDREYEVMNEARELFLGRGGIEYFQMTIKDYLKADERKRIVIDSIKR